MVYSREEVIDKIKRHLIFYQLDEHRKIKYPTILERILERLLENILKETNYDDFYQYYLDNEKEFVRKIIDVYCPCSKLTREYTGNNWSFLSHLPPNVAKTIKLHIIAAHSPNGYTLQDDIGKDLESLDEMMQVIDFFENLPFFLLGEDNTSTENLCHGKLRTLKYNLRKLVAQSIDECKNYIDIDECKKLVTIINENGEEIETVEIPEHIIMRYDYFINALSGDFIVEDLKFSEDSEIFHDFCKFIKTGFLNVDNIESQDVNRFIKLYILADRYCIDDLRNICNTAYSIFKCIEDDTTRDEYDENSLYDIADII